MVSIGPEALAQPRFLEPDAFVDAEDTVSCRKKRQAAREEAALRCHRPLIRAEASTGHLSEPRHPLTHALSIVKTGENRSTAARSLFHRHPCVVSRCIAPS